ncbi:MAG: ABC transporter permease subunit, partial [Pseudomonadota bacterium]
MPEAGVTSARSRSTTAVGTMRQYYLSIPREVEEAAQIDGASYLRLWWSVIVPMSRPLLAALAILF